MRRRILVLIAILLGSAMARAAGPGMGPDFPDRETTPAPPERKQPSVFHRPACRTPAEQLAYARRLEEAGHGWRARRQYRALVHAWHNSPEAVTAQESYARLLEQSGRYESAFNEYQYLLDRFPGRVPYLEIVRRQAAIANFLLTRRRGKVLFFPGFASPERALPLFEQVVRNVPQGEMADEARFRMAAIHEQQGEREEAAAAYEEVYYRNPNGPLAPEAAFRRALCLSQVAEKARRDEASLRAALSALASFVRDYPSHDKAPEAEQRLARLRDHLADLYYERAAFYDRIARRPGAALLAYRDFMRQFPLSRHAAAVAARVAQLEEELDAGTD